MLIIVRVPGGVEGADSMLAAPLLPRKWFHEVGTNLLCPITGSYHCLIVCLSVLLAWHVLAEPVPAACQQGPYYASCAGKPLQSFDKCPACSCCSQCPTVTSSILCQVRSFCPVRSSAPLLCLVPGW